MKTLFFRSWKIGPARLLLLACTTGGFISCQSAKEGDVTQMVLTNTSTVDLSEKTIVIRRTELHAVPEGDFYPLILDGNADTVASQLDDLDGDGVWDELFFLADLSADEVETFSLRWIPAPLQFEKRTSVRFGVRHSLDAVVQPEISDEFYPDELPWIMGYQPYQTDGPTWENDRVGFRHYLDGRNSKDLFGKKVAYMSPETVGISEEGIPEDNYHVMEDWGRDVLSVGNSVGIGGIALKVGDSLARIGVIQGDPEGNVETTTFRILSEGPVRSVIQYSYDNWQPFDREYDVEETTRIWPGMYAYQNSVRFDGLRGDETALVGLVNINTDKPLTEIKASDRWVVLLTHDKQTYEKEWWLGLALILPADAYLGHTEAPETGNICCTYLAELEVMNDTPLDYFAIGCWELSDAGFVDPDYFQEYVLGLVEQLEAEVQVEVQ
jgi:hypothetical protein